MNYMIGYLLLFIGMWLKNRQQAGERMQKVERNVMPYFYDARDDIIELICAELFGSCFY